MFKWQYIHVSQNLIELRDNIFGFDGGHVDEMQFQDIELSNLNSRYTKDNKIYGMSIDVSNKGILYEREVWNFEQALGWIGGLIGLFYICIDYLV